MSAPLDDRHCRAEMRPGSGVFCGRRKGHEAEPGDTGHRQRGEDGGATWRDPPHPAMFQPDLCEQLTPATVAVWLRRRAREAHVKGDVSWHTLAMAAEKVERLAAPDGK